MPRVNPRATKGARNMNMVSGKARNAAIRRLLSYVFKYYPVQFIVVLVCVLLSSFTNVAGGFFTGTVVVNEYIMPSLDSGSLEIRTPTSGAFAGIPFGGAIAIMASILAVGTIALYVYNILMSIIGQGVQRRIRDELYDHMQDLPISYFDRRGRGDIMSVYTNDVDALREMLSRALPMVANSIVTMVACFVMMLLTDLMLTGVVLGVSLLIFFIIIYFTKMASRFFIAQQIELGKMNGYIEEMVNGQRVVKVFNYEKRNIEGFKKHNEQFFNYSVKANRFANLLMPTVNQVGNIQYVLIALIGSLAVFNHLDGVCLMGTFTYGIATVGTIVSFLMYSKAFVQPIGNVSQQLNIIALALAGATRIFEIIDAPAETDDGYVELVNAKEDENGNPVECAERTGKWAWKHPHTDGSPTTYTWLRGKITFNDVDFAYIPGKTVLHNISMYAEEGQKIAFVGPTGSGKTTITNLINRFYDIEDGKVRYDDININKIKKKDLRRSLGVVLQETKLFTGTVMENIRFGNLEATDEEVIAAAKLANAHNFITHLPDGYNTLLHSGGSSLSQGQRQLIAIARAAVANPPVMILDEATSSIDSRTESLVQEGMDAIMKGRTVFVIAHRLSTIKNSDVIMVLQDGRIIERGSHDQLLAEKGKYYQLYTGNEIANK